MSECIHCGEAPATVAIWCQPCTEQLGEEYMNEFEKQTTTDQEREQLIKAFHEMSLEIDDLRKRCQTIERNYPGFKGEQMFVHLSNSLFEGVDYANSLADYIGVATAENWKAEP